MPPRSRRAMVEAVIEALGDRPDLVEFVRHLAKPPERTGASVSIPIRASEQRIARVKARAEAEGTTVTTVVSDGITDYLAGDLEVAAPRRARRGAGQQRDGMLNIRPDADLVQRLKDHCTRAPEPWLKPSVVYAAVLERYDPPAADGEAPHQG